MTSPGFSADNTSWQYKFLQPLAASGAIQVSDEDTPELNAVREYFDVFPNFNDDSYLADVGDALCIGILDFPEIWTRTVTSVVPEESIWTMRKKKADPWKAVMESRQ